MKSFDRSSIPWTLFPEASRQTMRQSPYYESSEKEICSLYHRHALDTLAEKLAIAKCMGADEAPGV